MSEEQRCSVRLRFSSLVALTTLVSFCAGVVGVPIVVLMQADMVFSQPIWLVPLAVIVVATPIVAALNGALYGVLGYPLYRWITKRIDLHTYYGEFAFKSDAPREI